MFKYLKYYIANKMILLISLLFLPIFLSLIGANSLLLISLLSFGMLNLFSFKRHRFLTSLPISRRDYIKGIYLYMFILHIITIFLSAGIIHLTGKIVTGDYTNPLSLTAFLVTFAILSLCGLLLQPLLIYGDLIEDSEVSLRKTISVLFNPFMLGLIFLIVIDYEPNKIHFLNTPTMIITCCLVSLSLWIIGLIISINKFEQRDY